MGAAQQSRHFHAEKPCVTVSGVVEATSRLATGDTRVLVHLDPPYSNLITEANIKLFAGDFVLVLSCKGSSSEPCIAANPSVQVPTRGDHLYATGAYVTSLDQGWTGLFPVFELKIG
jgi:hypothetical protein